MQIPDDRPLLLGDGVLCDTPEELAMMTLKAALVAASSFSELLSVFERAMGLAEHIALRPANLPDDFFPKEQ